MVLAKFVSNIDKIQIEFLFFLIISPFQEPFFEVGPSSDLSEIFFANEDDSVEISVKTLTLSIKGCTEGSVDLLFVSCFS